MPLQRDQKNDGLWFNPEWNPKKPGTFALIIGVSKYDYLKGDEQSYDLGQLYVSALTAYRFFCWLGDEYQHPDFPLAKVWLLLSPTAEESILMPDLLPTGSRQPTFAACEAAIGEWYETMESLDPTVSEKSRAIFFFSGHGLEMTHDSQILLLKDYLSPPLRSVNKALSTPNLHTGLLALPLQQQFFFLDACRNDHQKLSEVEELSGTRVLNEWRPSYSRVDVIAPIVHATGPGAAAWSPTDPKLGVSVFGTALLECLECVGGVEPVPVAGRCWVDFRVLEDYMDPRVSALLQQAGSRAKQPVMISGSYRNTPICEVPAPEKTYGLAPPPPKASTPALSPVPLPPGWEVPADSGDFSSLYDIFQNEQFTMPLWNARVCDLSTRRWTDLMNGSSKRSMSICEIARTEDRLTYQIEIELHQRSAQWLEFPSDRGDRKAACVLMSDMNYFPHYSLHLEFIDGEISGLSVALSASSPEVLGRAAKIWHKYRGIYTDKESLPEEHFLLKDALSENVRSPLAATMAALLLLRRRQPELLHNWSSSFWNWFPTRPDLCAISAERLLQTEQDKKLDEASDWLLQLDRRGLPHTAEALGHAVRQVREMLEFGFTEPIQNDEQQKRNKGLKKLQKRLNRALSVFRPGGLCTVFIGTKSAVTPELILPTDTPDAILNNG
jgi:hypothetical protein